METLTGSSQPTTADGNSQYQLVGSSLGSFGKAALRRSGDAGRACGCDCNTLRAIVPWDISAVRLEERMRGNTGSRARAHNLQHEPDTDSQIGKTRPTLDPLKNSAQ